MISYILLAVGIFLLFVGSRYLINGSSNLGKILKVKPILIGLTILAFGTSLPELAINIIAAIKGTTEITLGNVIGASIADILLILGLSSFLITLKIRHNVVKKGIPFTLFVVGLFLLLANDGLFGGQSMISRIDGIILLIFFFLFIFYVYRTERKEQKIISRQLEVPKYSLFVTVLMIFGGIIALFLGGELVVDSAMGIIKQLGVTAFLVSASVISIGSTLPEIMVSVTAALKKKLDFVVGNAIGSNIFNILLVLSTSSIIRPIPFSSVFNFDIIFLFVMVLILLIFMYTGKKYQLERWDSILFLVLYVFYLTYIFARG